MISNTAQAGYTNGAPGTPTYNWVKISVPATWAFTSPVNSSNNQVQGTAPAANQVVTGTIRCDVTDSQGHTSIGPTVTASLEYDNTS